MKPGRTGLTRPSTSAYRVIITSKVAEQEAGPSPAEQSTPFSALTLYASQFLLGPRKIDVQPGWRTFSVAGSQVLSAHPHLPVFQVSSADGRRQLTLLGEMLDPRAPGVGNEAILQRLLDRFTARADLVRATVTLGGRWVLIGADGSQAFLFHDALGLRQVFHADSRLAPELWVMSQPGIGLDVLGFSVDPEAAAFMDSFAFRSHAEYRWPGAASPIKELKRLQPNHWLDLKTGTVERYWPVGPLERFSAEQAADRLSEVLPGLVHAVAHRHDIALSLTAGIDSRLVLAAARAIADKVTCVTVRETQMPDDDRDITVPNELLGRLGLSHHVIQAPVSTSPEFGRYFKQNVFFAHDRYGPDAEAVRAFGGGALVALTGSGAEVGRCPFRVEIPSPDRRNIDAADLARLQRMGEEPFALKSFGAWLADARARFDVKLLDLFDWEQGHGSWLAMTQLEFDTAWRDIFTPYNSREVLMTLLGVAERYRSAPRYSIFRTLIKRLWPELLAVPINPTTRSEKARNLRRRLSSAARFWI